MRNQFVDFNTQYKFAFQNVTRSNLWYRGHSKKPLRTLIEEHWTRARVHCTDLRKHTYFVPDAYDQRWAPQHRAGSALDRIATDNTLRWGYAQHWSRQGWVLTAGWVTIQHLAIASSEMHCDSPYARPAVPCLNIRYVVSCQYRNELFLVNRWHVSRISWRLVAIINLPCVPSTTWDRHARPRQSSSITEPDTLGSELGATWLIQYHFA